MEKTIQFPFEWEAKDYHEFDEIKSILNKLGIKNVKFHEISDNDSGLYYAVFYLGSLSAVENQSFLKSRILKRK